MVVMVLLGAVGGGYALGVLVKAVKLCLKQKEAVMEQRKYKIKLTEPLLGSIPKDQQIFSRYVQSKYYGVEKRRMGTV